MEQTSRVYFDYAATTPVDERVLKAMLPYFSQTFGNPSSTHFFGQQSEGVLTSCRQKVASLINARSDEIYFTSGGTEGNNLAIRGAALMQKKKHGANHILISAVEHHAVSQTAQQLADYFGFNLELLPVDEYGQVSAEDVRNMIRPETALVSVIYANNEIGTINPIHEIATVCHEKGVLFHSDAVQAAAHLKLNLQQDGVDLLTFGAHKFYGPKGVGVLFARRETAILPVNTGGGQEKGLRAGTENIPYIVGLTEALDITNQELEDNAKRLSQLRDTLIEFVLSHVKRVKLTGHPSLRLPNHASFIFEGLDGNHLLTLMDAAGFACSSGSACKAGLSKPSEVILALGFSKNWAKGSLRVTLGRQTTAEQIQALCNVLPGLVERARSF
jgi:cysteine desulfurase